ncbi:MAG: response regulator [Chitinispirillia bacterium]|nr:response regulator [Chitinispirillia bacterium]
MTEIKNNNTLLIVDDDASTLMEFVHLFQPKYTIYTAKDGSSALERAQELSPDLILLDIIMPGMNGFEVLANLKKSDRTRSIPVIFITGLNENSNESEGLALGAVDYIRKPFDVTVVKYRIRNQIKIINLQRDLKQMIKDAGVSGLTNSESADNTRGEVPAPAGTIPAVQAETAECADENVERLRNKFLAIKEMCADCSRKGALDMLSRIGHCSKETKAALDRIKKHVLQSEFDEAESAAGEYARVLQPSEYSRGG